MPRDYSSRRAVIKAGVLGGIVGLAGCSGQQDQTDTATTAGGGDGGGGEETTMSEPTETPEPDVEYELIPPQRWIAQSRSQWSTGYEWGVMARQNLERLGLRFEWEVMSGSAWGDALFARDWDFTHIAWGATPDRIFPYYPMYFSFHSQFAKEGSGNFEMWASEESGMMDSPAKAAEGKQEYDKLVEEFKAEPDDQKRAEIGKKLQFLQGANQPVLFTNHPDALAATNTQLFGNWKPMFGNFPYFNSFTMRDLENKGQTNQLVYGQTTALERGYPNFFTMAASVHKTLYTLTYDPLTRLDYDGEPVPAAAKDWEVVDDTTIEVTLRDGMTFTDGEDVTAEDVKFTWDYITEHGIPEEKILYEPYESSEINGDNSITFNLSFPYAAFPQINMYRIPILPKHVWDGVVEDQGLNHPREWSDPDMTGSGPFEFVGYEPGSQLVLKKNPDHYWSDQFDFEKFVYKVYGSQAAIVGDLGRGKVAFTEQMGATHWNRAKNNAATSTIANPNIRTNGVWCRCDQPPFNDVLVRQALQHATNEAAYGNVVFDGNSVPARSVIAPANELYYSEETPRMEPSMEKARNKLTEAGLRWDDKGRLVMPTDWEPTVEYIGTDEMGSL
jgi:peptide/nickel transport system substrate-binding protein